MGCPHYLAETAAEFRLEDGFDHPAAWMACHFSPYGIGLSNLPRKLPPDSLLMVDDITPIHGHDFDFIGEQLKERVEALQCRGVVLDFQRPGYPECQALAGRLSKVLPCPVCLSSLYGKAFDGPVLLPPIPCSISPEAWLEDWKGRKIWLETALDGERITLTEDGASLSPLPRFSPTEGGFAEDRLHCHYKADTRDDKIIFTLWRTREDWEGLLEAAAALGVKLALGLYQEWKQY